MRDRLTIVRPETHRLRPHIVPHSITYEWKKVSVKQGWSDCSPLTWKTELPSLKRQIRRAVLNEQSVSNNSSPREVKYLIGNA